LCISDVVFSNQILQAPASKMLGPRQSLDAAVTLEPPQLPPSGPEPIPESIPRTSVVPSITPSYVVQRATTYVPPPLSTTTPSYVPPSLPAPKPSTDIRRASFDALDEDDDFQSVTDVM